MNWIFSLQFREKWTLHKISWDGCPLYFRHEILILVMILIGVFLEFWRPLVTSFHLPFCVGCGSRVVFTLKAIERGYRSGFKADGRWEEGMEISHLVFANVAGLFCDANVEHPKIYL